MTEHRSATVQGERQAPRRHPQSEGAPLIEEDDCQRVLAVMDVIGRRWSSGVLLALGQGAERFTEIQGRVNGLSARLLAVRLRELEAAGLVDRVVTPSTPVSVRYALTARGRELLVAFQPLARYAQRWEEPAGWVTGRERDLAGGDAS